MTYEQSTQLTDPQRQSAGDTPLFSAGALLRRPLVVRSCLIVIAVATSSWFLQVFSAAGGSCGL